MGRLSRLLSFVRRSSENIHTSDVQVDPGGGPSVTALHASTAGDDSFPLAGDTVVDVPIGGSGRKAAVAYIDTALEPKAQQGEKRIYARKADGTLACALWLKNTGDVVVEDASGNVVARFAADGTFHAGAETGAALLARADKSDAEIARIWNVLTTWTPVASDGGAALKAAAVSASASVQSTAATKVWGT